MDHQYKRAAGFVLGVCGCGGGDALTQVGR